ncbi:MAG: polymer-forming cytoskeletal protein [Alphaproteobacteria bacterium]|nr:polymer-forming cytoskeletal protein [Alphaproteobacteria bacterium]
MQETQMYDKPQNGAGKPSVLAADLVVSGVIATEGALEINGTVEGEVTAEALIVGRGGTISGKVRARRADVHGVLQGDLVCNDLVLRASSRLHADLTCTTLTVETGAEVEGNLRRPAPPAPPDAPQTLLGAEADLAGGADDAEG